MQYDAVFLFAYLNHAHYDTKKFHLPRVAPANPANKEGVIAPAKKREQQNLWAILRSMRSMTTTITSPLHPIATTATWQEKASTTWQEKASTKIEKQQSTLV
jgi:hypothetical protein